MMRVVKGNDPEVRQKVLAAIQNAVSKVLDKPASEIGEDFHIEGRVWVRARVELIVSYQYSVGDTEKEFNNGLTVGEVLKNISLCTN